ncbi:AraC family transcriptional regulator protein [Rhizobium etli 8C-3]|uniref:AraC family transcriptional regulator n=2 Tax=Rhizobium TaxID=379 RepID=A0A4R3RLJ5_9HYPH|nr:MULTISPECIES: GyrI-like domain-containing protein [Rhizobium]APO76353.1 AraC family transcriptional regulator protein [Rhizobium etli 8C-3]TCU22254.1 AraC family transcriptional regulator [Rhizobium azibense]TCU35694.1 AraC family transcriptional regulator [Rhizobium azibense]
MSAIGRAIWFIESHSASDISLDDISDAAGLSRYHLSRVFGLVTGHSISGYLRGRRLSTAALALIGSSSSILEVALGASYGSHEAFTRAFRDQFGITPDAIRKQGHLRNLALVEPIKMDPARLNELEEPRFETLPPMLFAGLQEAYDYGDNAAIPSLWQKFNSYFGNISGQRGNVAYGICTHIEGETETFRYMAGAEVTDAGDLPEGFTTLKVPAQRYVVFTHRGHVSAIASTMHHIFGTWFPSSALQHGEMPDMFERYDERFDPDTGMGIVEIWIPVKE